MSSLFDEIILALKQAALEFGSIRKLAEASGVAPENVSRWIAGTRNPSLKELTRVLEVMEAEFVFHEKVSVPCPSVRYENTAELKSEIAKLKADINKKDGQIEELRKQYEDLLNKIVEVSQQGTKTSTLNPIFSLDEKERGAA